MDKESLKGKIWAGTISFEEIDNFFDNSSNDKSDMIIPLLETALNEKNGDAVEYLIYAAQKNGVSNAYEDIFCRLLEVRESWMYKLEDVATLLGKIGSNRSVKSLCHLAEDYEMSDTHSIPLKAMWALYDIGTLAALEGLKSLSKSKDKKKAKIAVQQLEYLERT